MVEAVRVVMSHVAARSETDDTASVIRNGYFSLLLKTVIENGHMAHNFIKSKRKTHNFIKHKWKSCKLIRKKSDKKEVITYYCLKRIKKNENTEALTTANITDDSKKIEFCFSLKKIEGQSMSASSDLDPNAPEKHPSSTRIAGANRIYLGWSTIDNAFFKPNEGVSHDVGHSSYITNSGLVFRKLKC